MFDRVLNTVFVKINDQKIFTGVFRILSNIWHEAFFEMFSRAFNAPMVLDYIFSFSCWQSLRDIFVWLYSGWTFPGLIANAGGGGGQQKGPFPKICYTYPPMMKLGTVIPYLRKIQKMYKSPLEFSWYQRFFTENISKFCYIKKYRYRFPFNT